MSEATNHNGTTTPPLEPTTKKQDFSQRTLRRFAREFNALNPNRRE